MDPTEPTIDSQTSSSTINTNNSEAVSQSQKNTALSNTSVTTTEVPHVEAIHTATAVHLSMPSGLASPKDAQNTQNIATLDAPSAHKNDKPADIHDARLLNVTPGEFSFVSKCFSFFFFSSFTAQCRTARVRFLTRGFTLALFFF